MAYFFRHFIHGLRHYLILLVSDRGTPTVSASPSLSGGDVGTSASVTDKLNLVGRPADVAAELDRLAQSASARLNPAQAPQTPQQKTDYSSSEC